MDTELGFFAISVLVFIGVFYLTQKVEKNRFILRLASAVVLLTPMVYFGHPIIFKPLWLSIAEDISNSLTVILVWAVVFLVGLFFGWLVKTMKNQN